MRIILLFVCFLFAALGIAQTDSISKTVELKELTISLETGKIFGQQKYWIHDYEFKDGFTCLIAYKKNIENSELLILDSSQQLVKHVPIPDVPSRFFKDCFNEIHIVAEDHAFEIEVKTIDSVSILLIEYPISGFRMLQEYVGKINDYFYLEHFGQKKLSVSYYCFNKNDRSKNLISAVSDDSREIMYADEGRRLAALVEIQNSGPPSRGIATLIAQTPNFAEQVLYKKPVDAYLLTLNDSVYVFDFYNRTIEVYSQAGKYIRNMTADYGSSKTWEKVLLKDDLRNEAYTLFSKEGFYTISKISLKDGTLSGSWKIDQQYVKNIKVNDGTIYFIYRPFESSQTTHLYKMKM